MATPALVTSHPYTAAPSGALLRDPDPELGQRPPGNPPTPDPLNTRASSAGSPRAATCATCPAICAPATESPHAARERPLVQSKDSPTLGLLPPRAPRPAPGPAVRPRPTTRARRQSAAAPRGHPPRYARRSQAEGSAGSRPPSRCPDPKRGVPGPLAPPSGSGTRAGGSSSAGARRRLKAQLRGRRAPRPSPPPSRASFCQVNTPEPHLLPRGRAQRETGRPRG